MKIGVTGTREGATEWQLEELRSFLTDLPGTEFHHGDCVGVDSQAAAIARELGYKIVSHPPKNQEFRAYFESDETREKSNYLERNRAIVDECDGVLVVPREMAWQHKGGTWYTHDYAEKQNKPFIIIWPKYKEFGDNG